MKISRLLFSVCAACAVAAAFGDDAESIAGRWRFALGDVTNCTDTIALPSTTDIARKGDGRIRGVEVEKIDPMRDDAAVQNRLTRHPTRRFPTSFHSDYQWREFIFNGVNVVLDGDKETDVIVRGIDNITRNQNLGVIWEQRRGKGRALYCSLDLEAAKDLPEARALRRSLLDYLAATSGKNP